MTQEALKLALEALEEHEGNYKLGKSGCERQEKAITAIKEALAQEQEPVATVTSEAGNPDVRMSWWHEPALPVGTKLYTTPPQRTEQNFCSRCGKRTTDLTTIHTCTPPQRTWVGLTDEDICMFSMWLDDKSDVAVFTAIEAKLKEKNT